MRIVPCGHQKWKESIYQTLARFGKTDKHVFVVDALATSGPTASVVMEDDVVVVDESREEVTETMPFASWIKETTSSRHADGKFLKHCNGEESSLFGCWDWRQGQSDILQQTDLWAPNVPKSMSSAKDCLSVNFPIRCVSQKLNENSQNCPVQFLGTTFDEVPIEVAPCGVGA